MQWKKESIFSRAQSPSAPISVIRSRWDLIDAIKTFKKIYTEGIKKFKLKKAKVFIEHAKGYVTLGKPSIIIAVSSKHRSEAYQLSRYLIEQIKIRAPIWKKEYYKNQKSEWLKGTSVKIR